VFDTLSNKLQKVFKDLRGYGKLTEKNVADALREVRIALLEADVNYKVAKDFIERVKTKSLGTEVLQSVTPGQQIVKIIHDELVALMEGRTSFQLVPAGDAPADAAANKSPALPFSKPITSILQLSATPSLLMMVGLHGSGKTTTTGKLARQIAKAGKKPFLVACDVYRPAAVDQLETLAKQLNLPAFSMRGETDVLKICRAALDHAKQHGRDVLLFDTAGRLQIDETLVQELVRMRDLLKPQEILLVADAALGQEAVSVAQHFDTALGVTGIILTKLDGDARGGAALSMKAVTGKPIKFVGVGEKLDELEPFHADRMVSRILGMGDIVSLVEKAQENFDAAEARKMQEKIEKQELNLEDFLQQMEQLQKMGPLENILKMLPGGAQMKDMNFDQKEILHVKAMIQSMTVKERRHPEIINESRRRRIARGSGMKPVDVSRLLKQFWQMKDMMKQMSKMQKKFARMGGMKMR
jgi:signal recognition particle subunit SRP54